MKFLKLIVLLTLLLALVNIHSAWALASGLPGHDAYVYDDSPDENFDEKDLEVGASGNGTSCSPTSVTYMRWNLADISNSATIASATLTLTVQTDSYNTSNVSLTLYKVADDSWTEGTITWNNAPWASVGAPIVTQTLPTAPMQAGQIVIFSGEALRAYIAEQAAGDDNASFALRFSKDCPVGTTFMVFEDSESAAGGPYLLIQGPNAVTHAGLRIAGLDVQWPIAGALILGGLASLAGRRRTSRKAR